VGLVGTSSGNLIENNSMTGNSNGVLIAPTASGNTIRGNIVAGNPAAQITRLYGVIGFDIKDDGTNQLSSSATVTVLVPHDQR
jgi:parallel beta-helix repeat protein